MHWVERHPVPSVVAIVLIVVGVFAWAIRQTAYRYR
jgi:hypothetical protein